jgi:uncharacterized protein (TIGR03437 family)
MPAAEAQQSILGSNLVVNGGAEAGPAGTGFASIVASVPGWTRTGNANVLSYDITGLLLSTQPAPPDHAFQYFVAGAATSTLTQDIDVSASATSIGAGNVKFTASAYLGDILPSDYNGSAQVVFAFKNAGGQTFSTTTLGPLPAGVFGTRGASLYLQQAIGLVPPGTARVTVTLTLTSFNGGYGAADGVSLVFSQLGTSPSSILGANLITNANAESGPGASPEANALYVPGWSNVAGASVSTYGGQGWIGLTDPGPSDRGVNLFWIAEGATAYQDLDVSAAASIIDTGKMTYQLSAWLGATTGANSATVSYLFFDWSGKQLAATAQLGPVTHNGISLVQASHSDTLPAGTRRVRIVLGYPTPNTVGLADDISFSLAQAGAPVVLPSGVVPVFSAATTLQPGSWGSIFGTNLAGAITSWNGDFPESLGGTSVTVDSKPAYLWFVSPTQINFQVPDDSATGSVNVVVTTASGSATSTITLGAYGPSFSLYNTKYVAAIAATPGQAGNSGSGYDYIGPTGGLAFASRPARSGETIQLYGVGFGPTNPPVPAGALFSGAAPVVTLPQVTIGGVTATVTFAGVIEAGLYQLNVIVPSAGSGDRLLQATVGGMTTPANVYITLQ